MSHIEPVRKEIIVQASRERAFRVFTDGIDKWWPRQHHIGQSPLDRAVLEAKPGGRWYSICKDGSECEVGKVLTWNPPAQLVLAWQITGEWQFDPSFVTEVAVDFVALGPTTTRVTLEHRDLHRYGIAAEGIRSQLDSPGGWPVTLEGFARVANESAA